MCVCIVWYSLPECLNRTINLKCCSKFHYSEETLYCTTVTSGVTEKGCNTNYDSILLLHYVEEPAMYVWGGITLTGLTPSHVCTCPNPRPKFPTFYFVFVEWRWKIDIGRIVDDQKFKHSFHYYMVVIYSGTPTCLPRCVNLVIY